MLIIYSLSCSQVSVLLVCKCSTASSALFSWDLEHRFQFTHIFDLQHISQSLWVPLKFILLRSCLLHSHKSLEIQTLIQHVSSDKGGKGSMLLKMTSRGSPFLLVCFLSSFLFSFFLFFFFCWWSLFEQTGVLRLFYFWSFGCNTKTWERFLLLEDVFFFFSLFIHLISGNSCTHKHTKLTTDAGFCTHTHTHIQSHKT